MERDENGFRFNKGIPAHALMLDVAESDDGRLRKRQKLVLASGDVPALLMRRLRKRGADLRTASSIAELLDVCASTSFNAIVCDTSMTGTWEVIKLLKYGRRFYFELDHKIVADLIARYRFVPIFVLHNSSVEEYGVIISPPTGAYIEESSKVPLDMAVMRLSPLAMFRAMEPLA